MKKLFVFACSILAFGLCSFTHNQPQIVAKNMPRVGRKQARNVWLNTMKMYAEQEDYRHLGHIGKAAIEDEVSLTRMLELAEEINVEPFTRAIKATQNIRKIAKNIAISKSELFRIALYIEAELDRDTKGYLSRRKTGLERTIEFDPESNLVFIHLKNHGVEELGHGVKKVVTKSILYDVTHPKLVARCSSKAKMVKEMRALKLIQGSNGIVKLHACTERKMKDGQAVYDMLCHLYQGGTLSKAFTKKYPFSFKQKLHIARDLIEGLDAIHAKGLVHRDLSARNVFIDYEKSGKRKLRHVRAAIGDFGRCRHIDNTSNVRAQFNNRYLAPEAIINEKLEGEDYFATDLYAVGCILHRLFYEKSGPWIDVKNLKNPTQPAAVKEAKLAYDLKRYREMRLAKLVLKGGTGPNASTRDRFEQLILQLLHHEPTSRGSAEQHARLINEIVDNFESKRSSASIHSIQEQTTTEVVASSTDEQEDTTSELESSVEPSEPHVPTIQELLQGRS